jgi:hypothetical protein
VSETEATCPKNVRNEAAEVMRCVWELLREPAFASTLAHLISRSWQREETNFADCVPRASGARAK